VVLAASVTATATAVSGKDNSGDSNGGGHSQQSTKYGSGRHGCGGDSDRNCDGNRNGNGDSNNKDACQRWRIKDSNEDDTFGICLAVKDYTIALTLPLPPPPPPLQPPPLLPLCQNVCGNGSNNDDDNDGGGGGGGSSGGSEEDDCGNSGCMGVAHPCLFVRLARRVAPKHIGKQRQSGGRQKRSFNDEPTYCILFRQIYRI
jgi:hypothetical protein